MDSLSGGRARTFPYIESVLPKSLMRACCVNTAGHKRYRKRWIIEFFTAHTRQGCATVSVKAMTMPSPFDGDKERGSGPFDEMIIKAHQCRSSDYSAHWAVQEGSEDRLKTVREKPPVIRDS